MLAFEGGTLALGGLLMWASAQRRLVARNWLLLAAAAGTSLGVSDVALKALARPFRARRSAFSVPGPPSPSWAGSAPSSRSHEACSSGTPSV